MMDFLPMKATQFLSSSVWISTSMPRFSIRRFISPFSTSRKPVSSAFLSFLFLKSDGGTVRSL